jgi:Tol biopolymer transport system component
LVGTLFARAHRQVPRRKAVLSRDGRTLVYRTGSAGTADLWYRRVDGDTAPKPIATTRFTETAVRMSPDGQWLTYVSDESGQLQVYVVPFPGPGARYQVTTDGGSSPVWSPDGRQLFYVHAGRVMTATRAPGSAFAVASRELRQDGEWSIAGGGHAGFDVSPDARDLLLVRSVGGNVQTIVALNWRAEVRARAAGKK